MSAEPFEVSVTEAEIADLRERLRRTRWPEREPVDDWSQGLPLAYTQELCRSWAEDYDFGFAERLNVFPQYRDTIDGLGIHFLHVRSPEPDAFPLVLTHGWPGSVLEFLEVLGPLTDPRAHGGDPADAFHVVAPSLPGYGWSDKPSTTGWGITRTARAWDTLMVSLGYERYGAQGGDWGSAVSGGAGRGGARAGRRRAPEPGIRGGGHVRRPDARGAGESRGREGVAAHRPGVLGDPGDPAADARLRPHRLPGGAGRLDRREVLGMDGQRRPSRGRVVAADDPRRDLGLLVHRVGHVVGAPVLGELRQLPGQGRPRRPGCRSTRATSPARRGGRPSCGSPTCAGSRSCRVAATSPRWSSRSRWSSRCAGSSACSADGPCHPLGSPRPGDGPVSPRGYRHITLWGGADDVRAGRVAAVELGAADVFAGAESVGSSARVASFPLGHEGLLVLVGGR